MPAVVRIQHKAEIIRLYNHRCDLEGYTQESGRPSVRTLYNILNNCPSSQRKSLAGLDNIACEGSEAYDVLEQLLTKIGSDESRTLNGKLKASKRYLKGDFKCHVAGDCDSVPDHCRIFGLSDQKDPDFQG